MEFQNSFIIPYNETKRGKYPIFRFPTFSLKPQIFSFVYLELVLHSPPSRHCWKEGEAAALIFCLQDPPTTSQSPQYFLSTPFMAKENIFVVDQFQNLDLSYFSVSLVFVVLN